MQQAGSSVLGWARQLPSSDQHEKYVSIPPEESADGEEANLRDGLRPARQPRQNTTASPRRYAACLVIAGFVAAILGGIWFLLATTPPDATSSPPEPTSYSCGSTAEEARANNCAFDTMLFGFTHVRCSDSALEQKFLAAGNWSWQPDPGLEADIQDALMLGVAKKEHKRGLYTRSPYDGTPGGRFLHAWEYHLVRCAYVWEFVERLRAREQEGGGVWVPKELTGEGGAEHVAHCAGVWAVAARQKLDEEAIKFVIANKGATQYYTCVRQN